MRKSKMFKLFTLLVITTILFQSLFVGITHADNSVRYLNQIFTSSDISITNDIVYKTSNNMKLDLYRPNSSVDNVTKRPLLFYVHSGGFTGGDKSEGSNIELNFAECGYVATSVNYTLGGDGSTPPPGVDTWNYLPIRDPALVDEADALVYLINNAATYGIDTSKIVIAGFSAGGVSAGWLCYDVNSKLNGKVANWQSNIIASVNCSGNGPTQAQFNTGSTMPSLLVDGGTSDFMQQPIRDFQTVLNAEGVRNTLQEYTCGHSLDGFNLSYVIPWLYNNTALSSTGGKATFYQDTNYGGTAVGLDAGNYTTAQMTAAGIPDNWASSVKVAPGYTVEVYDNDYFGGTKHTFTSDTADFVAAGCNDTMSSIKIYATGSGTKYEAENGTLANGATVANDSAASGGKCIQNMHLTNASCQINNIDGGSGGSQTLNLIYAASGTGTISIYVNGTLVASPSFPTTGGWSTYTGNLQQTITLNSDTSNNIKFVGGNGGINLDYVTILGTQPSTKIEAETGTLANGATVGSDSAASGGASVQNMHLANASCQLNSINGGTGGSKTLNIIYAANGTGTVSIYVNGTLVASPSFPTTSGWSTYTGNLQQAITLNSGTSNNIKFVGGSGGINLDYITIQ